MKLVRSISGTWHRWKADVDDERPMARTQCDRLVLVGKRLEWDGRRWPGVRVCCDCGWYR